MNIAKKINVFISLFLCVLFMSQSVLCTYASNEDIDVSAFKSEYMLIANIDTDTVLYAKHAYEPVFCGFLPRIMLCAMLFESSFDLEEKVTISSAVISKTPQLSSAGLKSGDVISLSDLAKCVLVCNSQESCIAIAEHIAGSTDAFIKMMNERAASLGMTETEFTTVHGYFTDNPGWTTLEDVMRAIKFALSTDHFEEYAGAAPYVTVNVSGEQRKLYTRNSIIDASSTYYIRKSLGIAAYSSSNSQWKGAAADFVMDGSMRLVSIALSMSGIADTYTDMSTMLRFSAEKYNTLTVVKKNDSICEIPVTRGKTKDSVIAAAESELLATVADNITLSDFSVTLDTVDSVRAPVKKGDLLGTASYYVGDRLYGSINIVAQTDVAANDIDVFTDELNALFNSAHIWLILGGIAALVIAYTIIALIYARKQSKHHSRIRLDR